MGRVDNDAMARILGISPNVWDTIADVSSLVEAEARSDAHAERMELLEGERTRITLAHRILACLGKPLQLRIAGGEWFDLVVRESSQEWLMGESARGRTLVPMRAVEAVRELPGRAEQWEGSAAARLTFASALRAFMRRSCGVVVQTSEMSVRGKIVAVGADWMDLCGAKDSAECSTVTLSLDRVLRVDALLWADARL